MEKRSGDPLRIFVLLYRERVRLSSPQRGKKSLVQRTFFRDFIKTAHRGCGAQYSLSKNLVEFAPAGAKKVRSFSSATCAAKKIPFGLQTCAPAASGGQRVRCSQAANPFVKKYYFLTASKRARVTPAHARPLLLLTLPVPAPPRAYRQCSRRSPWRGLPAARASPRR